MTRPRPTRLSRRACLAGGAAASLGVPATARPTFKTEIIVRAVANLRNQEDVSALVALAAQHGVSTINIAAKQDEDDEIASGFVFYDSRIAPRAPGFETFDALHVTIREAHRHGIRVRAWVPQFHDQVATRAHPEWQMKSLRDGLVVPYAGRDRKEFFLNPMNPAARDYQRSIVEEVARAYDIDGIVIDWVRFDGYAMDLGDETRTKFKENAGFDPIEIDFSRDNPRRRQWNAWREAQIADHVRQLRATLDVTKPGLEFGAYILPPEFIEVAQDAAQFSDSVTFLSPMAYYKDWGLPASWIVQTLLPQTGQKAPAAAIIPAFDEDLTDTVARAAFPEIRRRWPRIGTLSWFVYGKWTRAAFQRIDRLLQS